MLSFDAFSFALLFARFLSSLFTTETVSNNYVAKILHLSMRYIMRIYGIMFVAKDRFSEIWTEHYNQLLG